MFQDPGRTNSAEDATLLQCKQSPLQESTMTSAQQHQAAEQSCFIKQDPATEEENVEATNDKAIEAKEETTVTNPNSDSDSDRNSDSEPQGFREQTDDDANRSGKDEEKITADECNRSQSQTCTDQLLLPTSEKGDLSLATALEEQVGSKENSQIEQETSPEEHSSVYMTDVKEVTKEAPAKKKRRMGMCGLTEKERSHFLQTQKRENGKNGLDRADLVAQEDIKSAPHLPSSLSILGSSITEQKEAEKTFQSSHCGGNDRSEYCSEASKLHVKYLTFLVSNFNVCITETRASARKSYSSLIKSQRHSLYSDARILTVVTDTASAIT